MVKKLIIYSITFILLSCGGNISTTYKKEKKAGVVIKKRKFETMSCTAEGACEFDWDYLLIVMYLNDGTIQEKIAVDEIEWNSTRVGQTIYF